MNIEFLVARRITSRATKKKHQFKIQRHEWEELFNLKSVCDYIQLQNEQIEMRTIIVRNEDLMQTL